MSWPGTVRASGCAARGWTCGRCFVGSRLRRPCTRARLPSSRCAAQVDILIVNCSLFNPTPSLSAMIVNHFKMKSNTVTYNLSGMGCSAGVISLSLARELLQVLAPAPPAAARVPACGRRAECAAACLQCTGWEPVLPRAWPASLLAATDPLHAPQAGALDAWAVGPALSTAGGQA